MPAAMDRPIFINYSSSDKVAADQVRARSSGGFIRQ
jgi:hypothetical protein